MALKLPITVMTRQELLKLGHEVRDRKEQLIQLHIKHPGSTGASLPRLSLTLEKMLEDNNITLNTESAAKKLEQELAEIIDGAPSLHFSFAANPSAAFLERLLSWLRAEINPYVLITVGLQPLISAGCTLRTSNKYYDLSMKQRFTKTQDKLRELLSHGR